MPTRLSAVPSRSVSPKRAEAPDIDVGDASSSAPWLVGPAGDPAEHAADQLADAAIQRLWSGSAAGVDAHRHSADCEHVQPAVGGADALRRLETTDPGSAAGGPLHIGTASTLQQQQGRGARLPTETAASMSRAFGTDLSAVTIHDDPTADQLNRELSARAFTAGTDVYFRAGEYAPQTDTGLFTLAHELAHVVQHQDGIRRMKFGDQRKTHVTVGDATGGGHMHPGKPGKTVFPADWDKDKIIAAINQVADKPTTKVQQTGSPGATVTKSGDPVRYKVTGIVDGVTVVVITEPGGDGIITGYPT